PVSRLVQYLPGRLERRDRKREHSTERSCVNGNSDCCKSTSSKDLRYEATKRVTNNRWLSIQSPDNLIKVICHLANCLFGETFRFRVGLLDRFRIVRPPGR